MFDVIVNGDMALANFDIFAEAVPQNTAVDRNIRAMTDSKGKITIQFVGDIDNAQVNGIAMTPITGWITVPAGQTVTYIGAVLHQGQRSVPAGNCSLRPTPHCCSHSAIWILRRRYARSEPAELIVHNGVLANLTIYIENGLTAAKH